MATNFQLEAGRSYRLFGADKESAIPTSCPYCAGGYEGPTQTNCGYCGTQRSGYMVETLQHSPTAASATEPIILPANSLQQIIRVGNNSKRARIEALKVILGDRVKVTRVEAGEIETGWQSEIGIAIARLVFSAHNWLTADFIAAPTVNLADGNFKVTTMVAKDLDSGKGGQIETLHLLPGGSANIGPESRVNNLHVGPNVRCIYVHSDSIIDLVWAVPETAEISSGANTNVLGETRITDALFAIGLQEALRKATQNRQSISAPR